jgi:hypothetical protein
MMAISPEKNMLILGIALLSSTKDIKAAITSGINGMDTTISIDFTSFLVCKNLYL